MVDRSNRMSTNRSVLLCKFAPAGAEDGSVSLFSSKDSTQIHHMTLARDGLSRDDPVNCVTFNPRETARFYVAVDNVIFVYDKRQLNG